MTGPCRCKSVHHSRRVISLSSRRGWNYWTDIRIRSMVALHVATFLLSHQPTYGFVPYLPHQRLSSSGPSVISTAKYGMSQETDTICSAFTKFLKWVGFPTQTQCNENQEPPQPFVAKTVDELDAYFQTNTKKEGGGDNSSLMKALCVKGDTQIIGSPDHPEYVHPVVQLLHERKRNKSQCTEGPREDGCKVALVVEGGGMRGCISAGMICAVHHLGLRDAVDVVYGSSAGSIIGGYFVTGQLPWFGPELYYDKLPTAGSSFIDTRQLFRALGFGWIDPRLAKDYITKKETPVLNLPFLLQKTLQQTKPLDWEAFAERQKVQPLKVVASALESEEAFVLDMEGGYFNSLEELSSAMHASCLLPGIAGPLVNVKVRNKDSDKPMYVVSNHFKDPDYEPLGDAMFYAAIPYESALKDGVTHSIVIRSRPDDSDVTGKGGFIESLIWRRFLLRKNNLPQIYKNLKSQLHKRQYAKTILELNEEAYSQRDPHDTSKPHALTIALPPGSKEVSRLENDRKAIFEGVRRGFARAFDALVEDPAERGRGHIVARQYFPDEILDYDPTTISRVDDSAFAVYMQENGIVPNSWNESSFQVVRN